jgi:hypothetical protein
MAPAAAAQAPTAPGTMLENLQTQDAAATLLQSPSNECSGHSSGSGYAWVGLQGK